MSDDLFGDDKPAVAVSQLVQPFGIVTRRLIPELRAGINMAEVRPLTARKSPAHSFVYDEESVAELVAQLATLRDQLATVTLERDALRGYERDAGRYRLLRRINHQRGFGECVKVVTVCPMHGTEDGVIDLEKFLDAKISATTLESRNGRG